MRDPAVNGHAIEGSADNGSAVEGSAVEAVLNVKASPVLPRSAYRGKFGAAFRSWQAKLAASDPGLTRLRTALRVILAVSSALLLVTVVITALGQSPLVPAIMAAVVAMLASMTMNDLTPGGKAVTAVIAPIAAGIGATASILTAPIPALSTASFIVIMFAAVWMRRYGARFFAGGFLLWMGFFMPLFIGAKLRSLPWLILGAAMSAGWVWLLRVTVLKDRPHRTLQRMVDAFWTRTWKVMQTASERLRAPDDGRIIRRLWSRRAQITEVALLIDGQLADVTAAPIPSRSQVRQWLIEVEMTCDEVCGAANELAMTADVPLPVRLAAQNALQALAHGQWKLAQAELDRFGAEPGSGYLRQLRRLGVAARAIEQAGRLRDERSSTGGGTAVERAKVTHDAPRHSADAAHTADSTEDDNFDSPVTLFGGSLPGTASTAKLALEEGPRRGWINGGRLSLTTRQAIQAALAGGIAIAAGHLVSGRRWYWAVIAAFVAFTGTSNAGETVRRTSARVGGTLIGLALAVLFANLTMGDTALAGICVFICIFGAFYVQRISYAAMMVFITIMLGQLYVLLGTYSGHTLVLRLEETAIGAFIGVAVSLLVLPTGTRATAKTASEELLKQLGKLLSTLADRVDPNPSADDPEGTRTRRKGKVAAVGGDDFDRGSENDDSTRDGSNDDHEAAPADLLASARGIDAQLNQVMQVNRAVTSTTPSSRDRAALQHRLDVLSAVCSAARGLAVDVQTAGGPTSAPMAHICRSLADLVTEFPAGTQGRDPDAQGQAPARLRDLDRELAELADDSSEVWLRRSRRHLQRMSGALRVLLDAHPAAK